MNTITLNNSEQFDGYFKVDASDNDTEVAYFKGNMNEAREAFKKDIEGTEEAEIESNFMIFCENNLEEISEESIIEEFNEYWINGGQDRAEANLANEISEEILKKQPSYPNKENAYSEALYEIELIRYKNNLLTFFDCEHDFIPINNDGKHRCRFCDELEDE